MLLIHLHSGNNVTIEGYSAVHEGNTDNYVPKWFTGTAITGTGSSISAVIANSKAGDMYLNTSTDNVYKSSSVNVWDYICNIKGATGAQGPQGPQGATGATGPAGPSNLFVGYTTNWGGYYSSIPNGSAYMVKQYDGYCHYVKIGYKYDNNNYVHIQCGTVYGYDEVSGISNGSSFVRKIT